MAAILSIIVGCFGVFFFIKDYTYFENGQLVLIAIFALLLVQFFFSTNRMRFGLALFTLILCLGVLIASQAKYNWRKDYIENSRGVKPFVLEFYVDSYPPLEEYLFASILKTPDWIRFTRDCIDPVLEEQPFRPECSSMKRISETYNIDIQETLHEYRNKMAKTALRVENGNINTKKRYLDCLSKRLCVPVPLLPPGVNPGMVDPETPQYLKERRAFWQLIDSNEITKEICDFMTLCSVLKTTGALNFN